MKVLYSQIKQLVPELKAEPQELGEVLTMIGLMMDGFQEVTYQGRKDYLLGLETRNRVDCLSVWGLAREVSAYYGIEAVLPPTDFIIPCQSDLNLTVSAKGAVKRLKAVLMQGLVNSVSPDWLTEFLHFYDINTVNLLVDLSNYVMIMTGYASHLLDQDRVQGALDWQVNKSPQTIKSLDGTELNLTGGELLIRDDENILALAGIVGSQQASIGPETKNIIAEMALYDHALIQRNARQLAVVTEASLRLSKEMDSSGLERAFDYLIDLILAAAGGEVVAGSDYFPKPRIVPLISFYPEAVSRFAGIEIEPARSMEILKSLRCQVTMEDEVWLVTPPSERLDLNLAEDLVEEVIRMNRYDQIPSDQIPALMVTADITSPLYWLKDKARQFLMARGFDEILSQPLVASESNQVTNYIGWQEIITQNSVNEECPALRLSLASGLWQQYQYYDKKNVSPIRIFEIGKVFGRLSAKYLEAENMAWLLKAPTGVKAFNDLRLELELILKQLGLEQVAYQVMPNPPELANPYSCYLINSAGQALGIIYKIKASAEEAVYLAEVNLEILLSLVRGSQLSAVRELSQKLVVLDANLELADAELTDKLSNLRSDIGTDYLWSLTIIDRYQLEKLSRYTVRVAYQGLTDTQAKELHQKIFA
jgi:phenylalanyl-tRNA synthetase beta chain